MLIDIFTSASKFLRAYNYRHLLGLSFFVLLFVSAANGQTPTVTTLRNMSFGTVSQTTTLQYNSPSAAEFLIQFPDYSPSQATGSVIFILPGDLTDGYGDYLPITFNSYNSAAYNVANSSLWGATTFDPNEGIVNASVQAGVHTDYFWLGGTITPGGNYVAGTYTGTVTVTVTVTVGAQQYTANQTIFITATLQGNVSLSATGTLDFGQVLAGTTPPSLSPQAGGAPEFTAVGVRNNRSTVTFSNSLLLNDGFGHTLNFTPNLYGSGINVQSGSSSLTSGSILKNVTGHTYYFWLGGSLAPIPYGQAPGTYSGTFVLTVNY